MRTAKDVEAYLGRLNRTFESADPPGDRGATDATFLVDSSTKGLRIAVRVDAPLVVFRVHIGEAPTGNTTELFRRLLRLNGETLLHVSFGLEGDRIVLASSLELENLDFNEVEATMDEIDMTLARQVPELAELSKKKA